MATWMKTTWEESSRACKMDRHRNPGGTVHKGRNGMFGGMGDGLVALHHIVLLLLSTRKVDLFGLGDRHALKGSGGVLISG